VLSLEKVSEENITTKEKDLLKNLSSCFEIRKDDDGSHWVYNTKQNKSIYKLNSPEHFSLTKAAEKISRKNAEQGPRVS